MYITAGASGVPAPRRDLASLLFMASLCREPHRWTVPSNANMIGLGKPAGSYARIMLKWIVGYDPPVLASSGARVAWQLGKMGKRKGKKKFNPACFIDKTGLVPLAQTKKEEGQRQNTTSSLSQTQPIDASWA